MIIKMCRTDREKSLYKCDRCGKKCLLHEKKGIYVDNDYNRAVKQWDLCLRCYEALERGVEHRK